MEKKKNWFVRFFCAIGRFLRNCLCFLVFSIAYVFLKIFFRCKVRGKANINSSDEARVFVANHYELYGPISMYLRFPLKFRPWIIDKMMDEKCVKEQMSLMIYNNYKRVPNWIKKIAISMLKNLMVFVMKYGAKGIAVSRENLRENLKTMKISTETLEKNKAIVLFPEKLYVREGVGDFQTGFEHLAKYYYQKTGKKISFYPIFVSEVNKEMYIEKPIVFDPTAETNEEKEKIVEFLHSSMVASYQKNEVGSKKYIKRKQKLEKKQNKQKKKEG